LLAYIGLILAWVYVAIAQHRLKRMAQVIKEVPADQRASLLAKEYNVLPKAGLSADQWIRSRKHSLFFFAFLAVLMAVVLIAVIALTGKTSIAEEPKETIIADPQIGPGRIPSAMMEPLPSLSGDALYQELRRRGSLTLDNSTLTIGAVNAHVTVVLACYVLRLQNGARIITNGNVLSLQPGRILLSGNSGISSFPPDNKQAPPSAALGGEGTPGASGGRVELKPFFGFEGSLQVYLAGQDGGQGGGPQGQPGTPGGRGEDAASSAFGCSHGGVMARRAFRVIQEALGVREEREETAAFWCYPAA
jgi:hypothetical protein